MLLRYVVVGLLSAGWMITNASSAAAQDFPNKPIRIITGSAGGGNDVMSRQIGQGISGPLGQPVVVDNRGVGVLSAEAVAKSPPDGYTLLVAGSTLWILPLLQKAPYDVVRDFAPISLIAREVFVVVVHPSLPVKSVADLIALAKRRPGELNYSNGSTGGTTHLAVELFKSMSGTNIVAVPYKGNAPAVTALVSGEVQVTVIDLGLVAPHLKAGRLKALAVTSSTPSALTPGLPTVAASGLPGYEWVGMTHISAPSKTPDAVINRLNQEIARFLNNPQVKERLLGMGEEVVASSPEQFAAFIKSDVSKMTGVIKDAGIKVN